MGSLLINPARGRNFTRPRLRFRRAASRFYHVPLSGFNLGKLP
ncbi:X8 domain-containing protein [Psidium guajava]|nr:X8 domain-containing protein [Psidium guajava]